MLMGEYHHNIDEKKRLVIPSKFRSELGNKFIITRGLEKCLFVYSEKEWNKIIDELNTLPFTRKDVRCFTRFFLLGRVSITSPLIEYAEINKECVIIGANDHLEIWALESWNKFVEENIDSLSTVAESLFKGGFNAL